MELKMRHPAPIGATVSRKTGEVHIRWADDPETQRKFGEAVQRMSRLQDMWADIEAKKEDKRFYAEIEAKMTGADAFRGAAT